MTLNELEAAVELDLSGRPESTHSGHTPGLMYNDDGSLDVYIQNAPPEGRESNWLPAPPEGMFRINYRIHPRFSQCFRYDTGTLSGQQLMTRALLSTCAAFLGVFFAMFVQANLPPSQWSLLELPQGATPVVVKAQFHLLDIERINDDEEAFEFSGVLTLIWQDSRQAFDPLTVGAQEIVYNGSYQFNELAPAWYPQAILANAAEVQEMQGVLVRVQPDGTSKLVQTVNATARSALNLRRYPFDKQSLEIVFEVLGFDDSEVVIEAGDATINRSRLQIPQWDLMDIASSTRPQAAPYVGGDGRSAALVVTLNVERQPFFLMRLVVLPLIIIMILSWSVFWMDRSSLGDRMAVSFVGILTAVAYQTMVSSIMTQISYVTLIHGFLYFSFMLMCATVVVNLVVGTYDRRGDFERGDLIDRRCRWIFPLVYAVLVTTVVIIAFNRF